MTRPGRTELRATATLQVEVSELDVDTASGGEPARLGKSLFRDIGGSHSMTQFRQEHRVATLTICGHEHAPLGGNRGDPVGGEPQVVSGSCALSRAPM